MSNSTSDLVRLIERRDDALQRWQATIRVAAAHCTRGDAIPDRLRRDGILITGTDRMYSTCVLLPSGAWCGACRPYMYLWQSYVRLAKQVQREMTDG